MRIAFVSLMYDAPWGGSEVLWAHTAEKALAEGHEVFVSTHAWPEPAAQLQKLGESGASFYFRPRYEATLQFRATSWLKRLPRGGTLLEIKALRRFAPDVVLVSQGGWNDLLFHQQLYDWLCGVPFLLICHNYHDPVRQNDEQRANMITLFGQAREVMMISNQQLRVLRRQLAAPLSNARVVQNPLNLPLNFPVPYLGPAVDDVPQMSVVASFDVDRKGQDVLLETLAAPEWLARSWHLNFYGRGPDQAYLERLVDFYGLTSRVTMHGHVTESTAIWSHTHLLIVPSRIESGPMVVQEAMLCGRPVVAADVGMVQEWLDDDKTGFIADMASVNSLNKALNRAWARQADWSAMGVLAAKRARLLLENDPIEQLLNRLVAFARSPAVSKRLQ
ncbi:glycosyltransferase family 4 protein [Hymenobacter terricola]|uniref:glycosyltransferase family 4 protein n=1 Tax=Hymenobacter terricola TaxID=2819236 RepID=UPI001B30D5F3|nr:glycosyltransferase family 4 protein [Hymenobacter terricola]